MAKANAQIEISVGSSRLASGLASAARQFGGFAAGIGRQMGRAMSKLKPGDTMKRAVGNFGGDMIGRGVDAVMDMAGEVRDYESNMQRLGQTTHQTDAQMASLEQSIKATARSTGVGRNKLVEAAGAYYDATSDVEGMSDALETFARTQQASGAGLEDLVKTSAAMKDSMGLASGEFESAFSGLIAQGEAGKITLAELAREAPALMAAYSKFGKGTGRQGIMEMNAAFQVGAKAFGTSAEAATGLKAMMGMLDARQKQLAASGVKVYTTNKQGLAVLRPLSAIVDDIAKKKIDKRKWGAIFGENREGRAFLDMLMKYPDLYDQIVQAGQKTDVVQEYAANRADSRAGRLELAFTRMKETIADAFTPERIEAFTQGIEELADRLGPVVEGLGKIAEHTLGNAYGAGKAIRGALGEANPFNSIVARATAVGKDADPSGMPWKKGGTANQEAREKSAAEWQDTVSRILAQERNGKTTKQSVREAYMISRVSEGGSGASLASLAYLQESGADTRSIRQDMIAEVTAANERGLKIIADAIANMKAPTVKLGDNQVATSNETATKPRRRAQ